MSETEAECPLCMEEFDTTDKSFKPCKCGYQVWNRDELNLFTQQTDIDMLLVL